MRTLCCFRRHALCQPVNVEPQHHHDTRTWQGNLAKTTRLFFADVGAPPRLQLLPLPLSLLVVLPEVLTLALEVLTLALDRLGCLVSGKRCCRRC